MPTDTTDQQITIPIGTDAADNPVAFINNVADVEQRLVRRYTNEADRTARMLVLTENDISTLATENRAEIYNGTNQISLFSRSMFANVFRTSDSAALVSNTTLQNDTVLFASVPAAGRFFFEVTVFFDSSTTADFKLAFTVPAGTSIRWGGIGPATTVAAGVGSANFICVTSSGASIPYGGSGVGASNTQILRINGFFLLGGTSGTMQLQWAQNTSDPTNTVVRSGSCLSIWRVE